MSRHPHRLPHKCAREIDGAGVWVRMQANHDAWRAEREVDTSQIPTITAA